MRSFSFLLLTAIMATACDKVELPILEPEIIIVNDSITFPRVDSNNLNRSFRKTYVEEFTGHKCITCPLNTALLVQQYNDNKERMIIASIHAGSFAVVSQPDYPTDFNTPYGTQIFTHFNMATQPIPSAIINRRTFSNFNDLMVFNNATTFWAGPIDEENANSSSDVALGVEADYIDSLDLFYITVSAEALTTLNGEYRLLVLCLEDSVVAEQLDGRVDENVYPKKIVKDYTHRHVLRAKLSTDQSLSGDPVVNGTWNAGEWKHYQLNVAMPENVVSKEKVQIVAVLSEALSEEVIQSEEVHVHIK